MGPLEVTDLPERALLLLDSPPIIYFLEDHPKFGRPPALRSYNCHDRRGFDRSASDRDEALARHYRAVLQAWQIVELSADIAESAARLRASLRLKLADAIQAASALAINAAALVTHDRDFSRVRALRIIS